MLRFGGGTGLGEKKAKLGGAVWHAPRRRWNVRGRCDNTHCVPILRDPGRLAVHVPPSAAPPQARAPGPDPSGAESRNCCTIDDNQGTNSYDAYMTAGKPYIILKLETKNPIELGNFVSEFTSVASQYDKFIKERYPH